MRKFCFPKLYKLKKESVLSFFDLGPRSRDMSISLFEAWGVRFELSSEEEIANISAPGPKKKKKVSTLCFHKL